jgi:hypothetical protein
LAFISEFNVQLLYLPGLKNVVADFLSRPTPPPFTGTVVAAADPVDFEEMAAEQNRCPETQRLLGGTSLKLAFRQTGAQRLAGDISTGTFRPIVPLKFRKYIFAHFNNVADFLSRPPLPFTGMVAAAAATDPVDFEEMAAEQNCCPETQRLRGGTSLKLAFRQTGAQRLAGDISTGTFCPIVPLKFR